MALPIPHVLSHVTEICNAETRQALELFESLVTRLEPCVKRELRFNNTVALEFPQIVASYLLGSLQRVRVTSWGAITSLNATNELLFVMAVRSMLESAANVAYLRAGVERCYGAETTRKELTYLALRMKFATRSPEDRGLSDREASLISSINVLTTIKALDRFAIKRLAFTSENPMTKWYERLCEFSHPNSLGNSMGSDLDYSGGVETFEVDPGVRPAVLGLFVNYLYVALYAFCLLYNECWQMLNDASEALPTWEPLGSPIIALEWVACHCVRA